ncbi:MAG: sporulation protein Spo0E [Firmicutes bacterium HGW-Firmicutes-7]|nr:MAG: sporulation protein Spo0E [Firmicutes bacterium HGW-Firmicutes-7]
MDANKLQEIREKLNRMIENGSDADVILQVSIELDELIENYMEARNTQKNCENKTNNSEKM